MYLIIYIFHSGQTDGTEPESMICKISGLTKRPIPFVWRLLLSLFMPGNMDEFMAKGEVDFFQKIIPKMQDTKLRTPKSYFVGKTKQ